MGRVVSHRRLRPSWRWDITASHLFCTTQAEIQDQTAVKLHGVFPSCRRYPASSQGTQFHRVPPRDSVPVVTPFMQAGTYPARNFATLGPFISLSPHHEAIPHTGAPSLLGGWTISSPVLQAALDPCFSRDQRTGARRMVSEDPPSLRDHEFLIAIILSLRAFNLSMPSLVRCFPSSKTSMA